MKKKYNAIKPIYTEIAEIILAVFLMFIFANLIGFLGLEGRDFLKSRAVQVVPNNPWVKRAKVYPGMSSEEIFQLHMETWERQLYEYEPISQFKEKAFSGKFVNITKYGFRKGATDQSWPPASDAFNIFVFGGSTTFSYGLPDWQTLPAVIEKILKERGITKASVYNFGRASFFSTHELLKFQALMMDGHIPDAAIFIDGINDFHADNLKDTYLWTKRIRRSFESKEMTVSNMVGGIIRALPAFEFGSYLMQYLSRGNKNSKDAIAKKNIQKIIDGGKPENAITVLKRYQTNRRLIETLARHYDVKVAFVWQPSPLYKYDLSHHLFVDRITNDHVAAGAGYKIARQWFDEQRLGRDLIWCADIQEGIAKPLYVDAMHYSFEMNKTVGECIVNGVEGLQWDNADSPLH